MRTMDDEKRRRSNKTGSFRVVNTEKNGENQLDGNIRNGEVLEMIGGDGALLYTRRKRQRNWIKDPLKGDSPL